MKWIASGADFSKLGGVLNPSTPGPVLLPQRRPNDPSPNGSLSSCLGESHDRYQTGRR
jgi:hypothetical protein